MDNNDIDDRIIEGIFVRLVVRTLHTLCYQSFTFVRSSIRRIPRKEKKSAGVQRRLG